MLFNSYEYIFLFLPVTVIGFFLIGTRMQYKKAIAWLGIASLFFYGWWSPVYIGLIISSIVFNYKLGVQFQRRKGKDKFYKGLLLFGVTVNLALIGYFKYANFFLDNANHIIGTNLHIAKIILPLGISFFTFQQIAYLVDTYKGEVHEHDFPHYLLFVTFFPQLIAGPIVHHKEMMPQFHSDETCKFRIENFVRAITIFSIGLFKKVMLADSLAQYVSTSFSTAELRYATLTFFEAWGGALAYTLQIYFDFSGYCDMAIGSALLFGINLPLNFNSPYKSLNIIDFWRRWHITLSRFMRDYLYIPLGGGRLGTVRMVLNLTITMLIGGLWHGAGWTFIIWGAMHGIYLAINHSWRIFREKALGQDLNQSSFLGKTLSLAVTLFAVIIGWVVFRAETIDGAIKMFKGMAGVNGVALPNIFTDIQPLIATVLSKLHIKLTMDNDVSILYMWVNIILVSAILFLPNSIQFVNKIFTDKTSDRKLFLCAITTSFMLFLAITALDKPSVFLYFQF